MVSVFARYVKPGGILIFTSGPAAGEVWSDNGGKLLYHASLDTVEYEKLLKKYGFEKLIHVIEDPECGNATVWVARRCLSE